MSSKYGVVVIFGWEGDYHVFCGRKDLRRHICTFAAGTRFEDRKGNVEGRCVFEEREEGCADCGAVGEGEDTDVVLFGTGEILNGFLVDFKVEE